jgi:DNA-binding response OmpR family regulator
MDNTPVGVAIFNSNDDTVELLRMCLELQGFVVSSGHLADIKRGRFDLSAFLNQHRPAAIIYDLAPPYEQSWNLLKRLRDDGPLAGYKILLTTTNTRRVEEAIGLTEVLEVVGKPYDLEAIVAGVRRLTGDSGTAQ